MKIKYLVVLLLFAACTKTSNNTAHNAVTSYLKKSLNDPASYEAVRWGKTEVYSRKDSAAAAAQKLSGAYDKTHDAQTIKQAIKLE